jgi:hypothetical protein
MTAHEAASVVVELGLAPLARPEVLTPLEFADLFRAVRRARA